MYMLDGLPVSKDVEVAAFRTMDLAEEACFR